MSKIQCFGFNLREEDYEIIRKMVRVVDPKIIPEIWDLRSFAPEISREDMVFLYGPQASKECQDIDCLAKIEFPDATKLDSAFGNEGERESAHEQLLAFKQSLITSESEQGRDFLLEEVKEQISSKSLPSISSNEVSALEALLKQKKISAWDCKGIDGKKIRVTIEPEDSDADIDITFRELYALKACTEALQIEEFEIVYKPTAHHCKTDTS